MGYLLTFHQKETLQHKLPNTENLYLLELTDAPVPKNKTVSVRASILAQLNDSSKIHQPIKTILNIALDSAATSLRFGDRIVVSAQFQLPKNNGNPEEFDYTAYLNRQGINATAYVSADKWYKTGKNTGFSIRRLSSNCRDYLLNICKKYGIEGDEFAVIAALTMGYKNALTPELIQSYSISGAMHVLAVSGLHVGIVYMVISFLFQAFMKQKNLRRLTSVVILLLLWGYAFMTGLSTSVVRATTMFSLFCVGAVFHYKPWGYNTLSFAAFVMLLYNPQYLFDVGFQLSYSAVIGIMYFQPKFVALLSVKNKVLAWLWELNCVSIAAQLVTFPWGLFYFDKFSTYFLLANLVVIPTTSVIIYGTILLFVVSPIPFIAQYVALLLKWVVKGVNFCVFTIEKMPFSALWGWINDYQLALIFLIIIFAASYVASRKYRVLFAALLSVLLFFSISAVNTYKASTKREMVVWSNTKYTTVSLVDRRKCYIFSTVENPLFPVAYLEKNQVDEIFWNDFSCPYYNMGFISFEGKTAYFWDSDELQTKFSDNPLQIDYLILSEQAKSRTGDFKHLFSPNLLVVSASTSYWLQKKIQENDIISTFDIRQESAFIWEKK